MSANGHQPLSGKVALVAGATRGAGRAFAVELAAAGATVYGTGRSSGNRRSEMRRPETIEGTATRAAEAGGKAVPVVCDHLDSSQVKALVSRIESDQGRLDILVHNIWGGDHLTAWDAKLWEHDLDGPAHGVTDLDGTQPHMLKYHREIIDAGKPLTTPDTASIGISGSGWSNRRRL